MLLESSRGLYGVISSSSLLILTGTVWRRLAAVVPRQTDTAQGIVDDGQDIITESVWTTRMSCQVNSSSSSRAEFFFYILYHPMYSGSSIFMPCLWLPHSLADRNHLLSIGMGNKKSEWNTTIESQNRWSIHSVWIYDCVQSSPIAMTDWPGWDGMALVLNSNHIPIDDTTTDYDSFSIVPMKSGW